MPYLLQSLLGSGLIALGRRYDDPVLGRFLQPDPIVPDAASPQSLNPHSYVLNNPLNLVDPTEVELVAPARDLAIPDREDAGAGEVDGLLACLGLVEALREHDVGLLCSEGARRGLTVCCLRVGDDPRSISPARSRDPR